MNDDEKPLTHKQHRYVENIAKGMDSRAAARAAGYSESYSRAAAHRLGEKPAVVDEIESIRNEARRLACYDVTVAMTEANEVIAFAKAKGNAMAFCKAVELRARLSGLLIERVEVATVDLRGSLDQAKERVLKVINGTAVVLMPDPSCEAAPPTTDQAVSPFGYQGPGRLDDPLSD